MTLLYYMNFLKDIIGEDKNIQNMNRLEKLKFYINSQIGNFNIMIKNY